MKKCCPTKYCKHYESDFDRFVKVNKALVDDLEPMLPFKYSKKLPKRTKVKKSIRRVFGDVLKKLSEE